MQIPADPLDAAALDAALKPGQARQLRDRVEIDWDRDGSYGNALSNVTSATENLSVKRERADSAPGFQAVLSGASAGSLSFDLNGSLLVAGQWVPVAELLSPYNFSSPLYRMSLEGTSVRWTIETFTDRGWIGVPQFTGYIDESRVRRVGNQVSLTAIDIPPALRDPSFWPPYAVDGPAAARAQDFAPQRGLASSLVDHIFNGAGLLTRPQPPWKTTAGVACLAYLPLTGSFAPSRGKQLSQAPWGNFQLFPEVYPISPGVRPDGQYWVTGPFGRARNADSNQYPGSLIYTASDQQPTWDGMSTSITAWIYCGPTAPGYDSSPSSALRPPVTQVHYGYAITTNYYAYRLNLASAGPTVQVQVENGSSTLRYGTHTPASDGWRHCHAQLDHTSGVVRCKLIVDGTTVVDFTGSTGSTTTATALNNLFLPQVGVHLRPGVRMSDVMTWQEVGAPAVVPDRTVVAGASVDPSLNEISYLPRPSDSGWGDVKDLTEVEFASVVVDELGAVHWQNRYTARSTASPQTITPAYPAEVGTTSTEDGRANTVEVSAQPGQASWQRAWEAAAVDTIVAPPGTGTYIFPVNDDVIAIESGTVPRLYQSVESAAAVPVWSSKVDSGYVFVYDGTETEELTDQNMVLLTDQSGLNDELFMRIQITNRSTQTGRFRLKADGTGGSDPQPALHIGGLILTRPPADKSTVVSQANLEADGRRRVISMVGGGWRQHLPSVEEAALFVLRRATQSIPTFDSFSVPGDPRRQVGDPVLLTLGTAAPRVRGYVAGITRTRTDTGLRDTLVIRATHAPGGWVLDDSVLGLLESTAILG